VQVKDAGHCFGVLGLKSWGDRQVVKVNGDGNQYRHSHELVGGHFLRPLKNISVLFLKTLPAGNTSKPNRTGHPRSIGVIAGLVVRKKTALPVMVWSAGKQPTKHWKKPSVRCNALSVAIACQHGRGLYQKEFLGRLKKLKK